MAPLILNLGARCQRVVTTHPAGQNPMVSIEKKAGCASIPPPTHPQPIQRFGEGTKMSCAYRIRTPDRPARRLIATSTQPSQFLTSEMPPSIHYLF